MFCDKLLGFDQVLLGAEGVESSRLKTEGGLLLLSRVLRPRSRVVARARVGCGLRTCDAWSFGFGRHVDQCDAECHLRER